MAVWLDEFEIRPGESAREALEAGLRSSDVLVALLDAESSSKPGLFFELGAAIGMGKGVVPVVPKDHDPSTLPRFRRSLIRDTLERMAEISRALSSRLKRSAFPWPPALSKNARLIKIISTPAAGTAAVPGDKDGIFPVR